MGLLLPQALRSLSPLLLQAASLPWLSHNVFLCISYCFFSLRASCLIYVEILSEREEHAYIPWPSPWDKEHKEYRLFFLFVCFVFKLSLRYNTIMKHWKYHLGEKPVDTTVLDVPGMELTFPTAAHRALCLALIVLWSNHITFVITHSIDYNIPIFKGKLSTSSFPSSSFGHIF